MSTSSALAITRTASSVELYASFGTPWISRQLFLVYCSKLSRLSHKLQISPSCLSILTFAVLSSSSKALFRSYVFDNDSCKFCTSRTFDFKDAVSSFKLMLLDSLTVVSASNIEDAITWLSVDVASFASGLTVSGELLLRSSHFLVPVVLITFPYFVRHFKLWFGEGIGGSIRAVTHSYRPP